MVTKKISIASRGGNHVGSRRIQWAVASARLIVKVCQADLLVCLRCGSPMRIMALITEPPQARKTLRHLIKTGHAPPGLDPASWN